jgi:DNA-binding beta-propeller fold protein YncE
MDVAVSVDGKNVYVVSGQEQAVTALTRTAGALTRVPDAAGCVRIAAATGCAFAHGMADPFTVAVSPDGKNVYVLSRVNGRVAILTRDLGNGGLTTHSCLASTSTGCSLVSALGGASNIAFTSDGAFAYVASRNPSGNGSGAVAAFARNSAGGLVQLGGTDGCVSQTGFTDTCAKGQGLWAVSDVVVSPDNKFVYATSAFSNAVVAFSRHLGTGALTRLSGTAGCISNDGIPDVCVDGNALSQPESVAISPDGKHLFGR